MLYKYNYGCYNFITVDLAMEKPTLQPQGKIAH